MQEERKTSKQPERTIDESMEGKGLLGSNYFLIFGCLIITFFYITLSSPGVGWRDGPEFAVTPVYLDVSHPSGFPTYNLLAKIITWLPWGALGFKITIFTALMSGVSIFLFALLLKTLHLFKENKEALAWVLAPLLLFALDQAIFVSSTELEVYSLNTVFLLTLFYCATRWHLGDGVRWLYAGAFLYGVASGNHAALSLYLPVLLILTMWGEPPKNGPKTNLIQHLKRLGILALFFLLGLSVYLLLIIRSQTDHLPVDFGRTNTLDRFWLHISDAKDSSSHFEGMLKIEDLAFMAKIQFQNLCSPLFWFSLPFFGWGLYYLWRKFQILSVALPLLIIINMVFFYTWVDGSSAFIPSIISYFLVVALGVGELGKFIKKRIEEKVFSKIIGTIITSIVILFFITSVGVMGKERLTENDSVSGFQSTEMFYVDIANLPPESLLLEDTGWFHLLALQYVYSLRPDITLINMTGIMFPFVIAPPEPVKMPLAYFPKEQDGTLILPTTPYFMGKFFSLNLNEGKRIFVHYGPEMRDILNYLEPSEHYLWLAEFKTEHDVGLNAVENKQYDHFLNNIDNYSKALISQPEIPVSKKAPPYIFYSIVPVLEYLYAKEQYEKVVETLKNYVDYFKDSDGKSMLPNDILFNVYALWADSARRAENYQEAQRVIQILIEMKPYFAKNHFMLALTNDSQGEGENVLSAYEKALELDPYDIDIINFYSLALAKYVSISEAVSFLDEYSIFLRDSGLHNSAMIVDHYRECLLLPPNAS
ncbi:MAG: DUF2723 domain-containing protein [Endomicrobium sp.]|jgi:hypothetical protein|nr:DUF2723 domain-containing protein [Endomicrobium sp.]